MESAKYLVLSCVERSTRLLPTVPGRTFALLPRALCGLALTVFLLGSPCVTHAFGESHAAQAETAELWTGEIYTSTYRAGLCFSASGDVRGVVHLHLRGGQMDEYHIYGSIRDNWIDVSHSSGHTFRGELVSADRVEGVISLKNGMKINLQGRRTANARLVPEDCAPLPE